MSCPPALTPTFTMPCGGSMVTSGWSLSATRMYWIQIGSAALPPYSR